MGGFDRMSRPKQFGPSAEDITRASDGGGFQPGKQNLVQTTQLGNRWIDHGASCDGRTQSTQGCFLEDGQRSRLLISLGEHVLLAAGAYGGALTELKMKELLKRQDDLHWALSLTLDIIGAHFLATATKALKRMKAAGAAAATTALLDAGTHGLSVGSWASRADTMLEMVTDKRIEAVTKAGLDAAKRRVSGAVAGAVGAGERTDSNITILYIEALQGKCNAAFLAFLSGARGTANDAELVVVMEAMQPEFHTVPAYTAALGEKLDRFRASGVPDIGRKEVPERLTGAVPVHRDTRVVWLRDISGGKTLWYQSQDGDIDYGVIHPGDPGYEGLFPEYAKGGNKFGPRDPREAPQLGRRVPSEFHDVALARSEHLWGPTPVIDEPYLAWLHSVGVDPGTSSRLPFPQSPFAPELPPAKPVSSDGQLPRLQLHDVPSQPRLRVRYE